jgi:hypothetical protein
MYEMEWFTFHHLMESIAMQEQGPKEALDVIQKRLKHGTCHQQLRLLEVRRKRGIWTGELIRDSF